MQFTAAQIAQLINGSVEGNPDESIFTISKIEEAQAGALAFIANPKYESFLYSTKASIVLINQSFQIEEPPAATVIRVPDAYAAFAQLLSIYEQMIRPQAKKGVEQPAFIHPSAILGKDVYVGAFAYIGENVTIGDDVQIYPQAYIGDHAKIGSGTVVHAGSKIYHHCEIGKNVLIHSGVVIGSDGFGFAPQADGSFKKVPQLGNVIIEDEVEIGANTTIDRATMGATHIHQRVKLDNLIQIAHNVVIGEDTAIAAQTGISGSTKIGRNCIIGGQVGTVGHIQIADGTRINAKSGISKTVKEPNTALSGAPAFDYKDWSKSKIITRNLPALAKKINVLEEKINALAGK
jgi:UDP-3-O-[3-hydroxymyristoyl] glucosamine N-acyltransferase